MAYYFCNIRQEKHDNKISERDSVTQWIFNFNDFKNQTGTFCVGADGFLKHF
jgi:hypothetical protein